MRLAKKPVTLPSNVFRNIGARYKRIRKRPRGKPSPQLYAYKKEKLQELEELDSKGELVLYYADESHVCTNGYVPYGWQFKNEDVYIPSEKAARLNIFGMITKRNQYKGFTTKESINADKIVDYLDRFSFNVTKKTVIVLDNASVHRNRKVKELRKFGRIEDCSSSIFHLILQNLILPRFFGVYLRANG